MSQSQHIRQYWLEYSLLGVWILNCIIAGIVAIHQVWMPHMNAWSDSYKHIKGEEFDGTVMPITYIPDWTKAENQNKSKRFEEIDIKEYLPIPTYDASTLIRDLSNTTKSATILHYTYTVPYMWSYNFNYKENDGSHLGIDIRAPIWTPVLSIANGVVIKTVEADATGNKYVVIRHDNVPLDGKKVSLYSGYLHLSQITATEGTTIRKWEMLWRVGITGITTTPHLHFQIDTADAPFHPYWPFTSSDSRNAGLGFFESVNSGLGKEKAFKYTIHPLNFVNTYLGGYSETNTTIVSSTAVIPSKQQIIASEVLSEEASIREREIILGSYFSEPTDACEKKRFVDIEEKTSFWKSLYSLVDDDCLFQKDGDFEAKETITQREVIINLMKFYKIEWANWTSHFLDLSITDELQWYAIVLYRRGIIDGNYLNPDKILTKWEFIELAVKIGNIPENPWQIRIFSDVDTMNPYFRSVQSYGFAIRARSGKFYPNTILTRASFVQILSTLKKIQK